MSATLAANAGSQSKALNALIWAAQVLVAAFFIFAGYTKLTTPIEALSAMMPWTGDASETFVRIIGLIDLAGGLGVLLPALTRILPGLTVLAALGCSALQVFALVFHLWRGEAMMAPINIVLLGLSLFILWGRGRKIPIRPRA